MPGFKGKEQFSIDEKGRVSFPAKMKKYLPPKTKRRFTVLRGWDRQACLLVYPQDAWEKLERELHARLNPYVEKDRLFLRHVLENAEELELDGAARLCIPRHLLDLAGIEKQALLIGVSDHIELWNPDRYHNLHKSTVDNISDLAAEVMGDGRG